MYIDKIEKIVIMEEVRDELVKQGFLIKMIPIQNENGKKNPYMLGPNSLSLISAWETEEFSKKLLN